MATPARWSTRRSSPRTTRWPTSMFGVDDTFLSRALDEDDLRRARQPVCSATVDGSLHSMTPMVTPIDFGDVCINYDKAWFDESGLAGPHQPGPASGPGLRRALSPSSTRPPRHPGSPSCWPPSSSTEQPGWLDFWADLHAGGVKVAPDWDTAYYADFVPLRRRQRRWWCPTPRRRPPRWSSPRSRSTRRRPGSSRPGCYRQIEYAGILDGTLYPEAAGRLDRLHAVGRVPGDDPADLVRVPGQSSTRSCPEVFIENTVDPRSTRCASPPRRSRGP